MPKILVFFKYLRHGKYLYFFLNARHLAFMTGTLVKSRSVSHLLQSRSTSRTTRWLELYADGCYCLDLCIMFEVVYIMLHRRRCTEYHIFFVNALSIIILKLLNKKRVKFLRSSSLNSLAAHLL